MTGENKPYRSFDVEGQHYEVGSSSAMAQRHGLTVENRPSIKLNPEAVPERLRSLIPDAELLGVADDVIRERVIQTLSTESLALVAARVRSVEAELTDWLADLSRRGDVHSPEFVAFSCLTLAV